MPTTESSPINVISDYVAVDDASTDAGSVTWWRLSGNVHQAGLRADWEDELAFVCAAPAEPTLTQALRRALDHVVRAKDGRVTRALKGHGAYAVLRETVTAERVEYVQIMTVRLTEAGQVDVVKEPAARDEDWYLTEAVTGAYQYFRSVLTTEDVSTWLTWVVLPALGAVSLRERGGLYFVPGAAARTWERAVEVISKSSAHAVFAIPAMQSDSAVVAILDALSRETEAELQVIEDELVEQDLGGRALQTRANTLEARSAKLAKYEQLLGVQLTELRAQLERLACQTAVALLAASASDEGN